MPISSAATILALDAEGFRTPRYLLGILSIPFFFLALVPSHRSTRRTRWFLISRIFGGDRSKRRSLATPGRLEWSAAGERESEKMREGGRFELATKPRLIRQATQIVFSPFLGVRGSRSAPWMSISCEDRKKGIF